MCAARLRIFRLNIDMANFEKNKEKYPKNAMSRARRIWKEAKDLEKRSQAIPANELPWLTNILKKLNYVKQGNLERQLEDAEIRRQVEEALGPIPPQKKDAENSALGWEHWALIASQFLQPLVGTYAAINSSANPFIGTNTNTKGSEQAGADNASKSDSGSTASAYVHLSNWVRSKFFSSFGTSPEPPVSEGQARPTTEGYAASGDEHAPNDKHAESDALEKVNRDTAHPRHVRHAIPDLREYHHRQDDFGNHVHNQTSKFMVSAVGLFPTRRQLGEMAIRDAGHDPERRFTIDDVFSAYPESMTQDMTGVTTETKTLLDLYLEDSIVKIPIFQRTLPREAKEILENLPNIDYIFDVNANAHRDSVATIFSEQLTKELVRFGINHAESTTLMAVRAHVENPLPGQFGAAILPPRHFAYEGDRGYILKVDTGLETQYFAVTLGSNSMVHRVPNEINSRNTWIKEHTNLFFKDSADLSDTLKYTLSELESNIDSNEVADKTANLLWNTIFPILKKAARQDTEVEDFIHMFRGLLFPGYDIGLSLREGDSTQALIYFGWEIIPYIGPTGKKMVKVINKGAKWMKKARIKGVKKIDDAIDGGASARGNPDRVVNLDGESTNDIENFRHFSGHSAPLSATVLAKKRALEELTAGDSWVQYFKSKGKTHSRTATRYIRHLMKKNGYNARVRLVAIWDSLDMDLNNTPRVRTVVVVWKNDGGPKFTIDSRADHFRRSSTHTFKVDTEENWARSIQTSANSNLQNGVIKYADFDSFSDTRPVFRRWVGEMPGSDLGPGVTVLGGSSTYTNALKDAPRVPSGRKSKFGKYVVEVGGGAYDRASDAYGMRGVGDVGQKTVKKVATAGNDAAANQQNTGSEANQENGERN